MPIVVCGFFLRLVTRMSFHYAVVAILMSINAAQASDKVTDSDYYGRTTLLQIEHPNIQKPPFTHYFELVASTPVEIVHKLNKYASTHVSVDYVVPCSEL